MSWTAFCDDNISWETANSHTVRIHQCTIVFADATNPEQEITLSVEYLQENVKRKSYNWVTFSYCVPKIETTTTEYKNCTRIIVNAPLVLWHCWLGISKGILRTKICTSTISKHSPLDALSVFGLTWSYLADFW